MTVSSNGIIISIFTKNIRLDDLPMTIDARTTAIIRYPVVENVVIIEITNIQLGKEKIGFFLTYKLRINAMFKKY